MLALFTELRRRRVYQAAAIYIGVAFGATEILLLAADTFGRGNEIKRLIVIAFLAGFPLALWFAWAVDVRSRLTRTLLITAGITLALIGVVIAIVHTPPDTEARIAVVPCEFEGDRGAKLRAGEFAQTLHIKLRNEADLQTPPWSSVLSAASDTNDSHQLASQLNVTYMVTCIIKRENDAYHVHATLRNAEKEQIVLERHYVIRDSDAFTTFDDIAEALAGLIAEKLPAY